MAELLSSSSDEEGGASSPLPLRAAAASSSRSSLASSFGATDRSQSQDGEFIESLLSPLSQARTPPTRAGPKPVISAREMLLQLLPGAGDGAARHAFTSPPPKPRTPTATFASNSSRSTASTRPPPSAALSASERIARKYGLMRAPSPDNADAGAADGALKERRESEEQTRQAAEDAKVTRASLWDVERSGGTEAKSSATPTKKTTVATAAAPATPVYVSPFAGDDGFLDARRRRRQAGDASDRAVYDDSKSGAPDIGHRPRHVVASAITTAAENDESVEGIESDDGWMSDAKDVSADQLQQRHEQGRERVRASPMAPGAASVRRERSALPLRRVHSQSLKRPRKQRSDSDEDGDDHHQHRQHESDPEDAARWPRLPFPEGPLELTSSEEGVNSATVCANINSFLFDYQREGAQFLFDAYTKSTGAILGDEMGLGKTIQVIAFIAAVLGKHCDLSDREAWHRLRRQRRETLAKPSVGGGPTSVYDTVSGPGPILIVVPASLLHNWEAELQTWLCCCTVLLYGKPKERDAIVKQIPRGEYEIVICSYDILKMTYKALNEVPWEVIIFDEMHCLKNPEAQLTQSVQAIKCPRKLGLTGTLMQNNEKELHCLIDTIAPGVLGTWNEFRAYYGDDIKYGRKKSAVAEALERSRRKEKQLRQVLAPYYLRREKEINPRFQEIKKCDQVVFCDLTPYQLAAYKRILAMPEFELLQRGDETCDCGRKSKRKRKTCCYQTPASLGDTRALIWERFHEDGEACRNCPNCVGLVCVAQLLKLSNHMELLKVNPRDSPEMQRYGANFAARAFGDDVDSVGGVEQVSSFQEMRAIGTQTCGKMLVLEKLLALWKKRRQKTLLFSRSTRMLDILQLFLIGKAITYLRLDGNTKVDDRLRLVNEFNSPESTASVFLISTRAGGLGLNLPTATNVVIFDPSWNPAHDCQAQDRAYRIGQTKDVQVYRLITLGTIEEMIYVRQIYKQQLSDTTLKGIKAPRYFEGVQGDRHQQGELFGIRNLLCWKEGGVLKGIQDAYVCGTDGLVMQENQIDYAKAAQATNHKSSRRHAEEEMVEIADELVSNIVTPEGDDGAVADQPPSAPAVKSEDSDEDTEGQLLSGARTFMHEAIVGENLAHRLSESESESEVEFVDLEPEQEQEQEPREKKKRKSSGGRRRTNSPSPAKLVQKQLNGDHPPEAPKRQSALAGKKPAQPVPPLASVPRTSLYLPKYL